MNFCDIFLSSTNNWRPSAILNGQVSDPHNITGRIKYIAYQWPWSNNNSIVAIILWLNSCGYLSLHRFLSYYRAAIVQII